MSRYYLDPTFSHFGTVPTVTDRQTDGTHDDSMTPCHYCSSCMNDKMTFFGWQWSSHYILTHVILLLQVEQLADFGRSLRPKATWNSHISEAGDFLLTCTLFTPGSATQVTDTAPCSQHTTHTASNGYFKVNLN